MYIRSTFKCMKLFATKRALTMAMPNAVKSTINLMPGKRAGPRTLITKSSSSHL